MICRINQAPNQRLPVMLPFRPAAPGHPIYPPSVAVPIGSASKALYGLSTSRSVGPWHSHPLGYFSQPFPPPCSNRINAPFVSYHRINPVFGVRPIMYPVAMVHRDTAASSTGIEPVTPSSSPELAGQKTASPDQTVARSSDQTGVEKEIGVIKADGTDKPMDDNRPGKADSTQPTRIRPNKVINGPRSRTTFNTSQLRMMRDRFGKHPYIDPPEAIELAYALGITEKSLSIWFANERRRVKFTSKLPATPQLSRNYSRRRTSDLFTTSEISRPNDALIEKDTHK